VKHHFLLDENVLHHAVRGVDNYDNQDTTSAELILRIARNCHRIVMAPFLHKRYMHHIRILQNVRGILQATFLLNQLIQNSEKLVWQYDHPPALPPGCSIPAEDIEVVRSALLTHPTFVTPEDALKGAINRCEALHLRAIDPPEALILANGT
jgi:hypothetical protein